MTVEFMPSPKFSVKAFMTFCLATFLFAVIGFLAIEILEYLYPPFAEPGISLATWAFLGLLLIGFIVCNLKIIAWAPWLTDEEKIGLLGPYAEWDKNLKVYLEQSKSESESAKPNVEKESNLKILGLCLLYLAGLYCIADIIKMIIHVPVNDVPTELDFIQALKFGVAGGAIGHFIQRVKNSQNQ